MLSCTYGLLITQVKVSPSKDCLTRTHLSPNHNSFFSLTRKYFSSLSPSIESNRRHGLTRKSVPPNVLYHIARRPSLSRKAKSNVEYLLSMSFDFLVCFLTEGVYVTLPCPNGCIGIFTSLICLGSSKIIFLRC